MKQQTYIAPIQVMNSQLDLTTKIHSGNLINQRMFPHKQIWKVTSLFVCLFSTGLLSASCASLPKDTAEAQSQQRRGGERGGATPVDVAIARTDTLEKPLEYPGTTIPFRTVSLRSQVEARLLSLNVDVGDRISKGQNIGQLDDTLLLTDLKQAEAELAAQKSEVARAVTQVSNARAEVERLRLQLVQAQADSERQQKLYREGAIAEQTAEQAGTQAQTAAQALRAATEQVRTEQQAVAAAQGRVLAQQAVVAQAKERRSYSRLVSPISGVVTGKVTEPGNLLQAGGEVLQIGDFSRVKVVVQVSELELAKIKLGQSVQVRLDAFPQTTLTGRVIRISPAADATARLIPVEVEVPNSNGNIGSGLLARVNFATLTQPRVVIPQTAIQKPATAKQPAENQTDGTIFVVTDTQGKPTVKARTVTLGKQADSKVEILSGLQPGERYVTRSGRPLKDGNSVRLSILSETGEANSTPRQTRN
ncbi:efflux RND transporter periplasmic adaptor subunit [Nostoc sp. FACHB-280]|uniref:efflux RND transporter periplasmic adaptor subunit n=1 Tax=Nostoc sp. FACHB-280 TaxID=2692839 RepID=UPI00168AD15F|nr:efflux RND transporter periplasmic adaptor subunit [Nostoc sp. FACHB-280]MBD2495552.1 efflux RND transporter periplasmic adaptor subunit [Nostoc sp. FACHB-280]